MKNFRNCIAIAIIVFGTKSVFADSVYLPTADDETDDLTLGLESDKEKMCYWDSPVADVILTISNTLTQIDDSIEVILDSLETTETVYYSISDEEQKKLNRPIKESEHTFFKWAGRINVKDELDLPETKLKKTEAKLAEATFDIPEEDGLYQEVLEVYWHLSENPVGVEAVPGRTKKVIYYEVKDGCVKFIKAKAFIERFFPRKEYEGERNGKKSQNERYGRLL